LLVDASCAATRTRPLARRTVPVSTVFTCSAEPISSGVAVLPRYASDDCFPATDSPGTRASRVDNSSAIPSAKYALAVSPPTAVKGMTASESMRAAVRWSA